MNCRTVRRRLPTLVGEDLSTKRALEIRSHLLDCFACARRYAGWREPFRALREEGAAVPDPPPQLWEGIRRAIDSPAPAVRRRWVTPPRVAAAAVLAIALATGGSLLGGRTRVAEEETAPVVRAGTGESIRFVRETTVPLDDGIEWGRLWRVEGPVPAFPPNEPAILYPILPWVPLMQPAGMGPVPIQPVAVRTASREF